jgi:hypothetical protein
MTSVLGSSSLRSASWQRAIPVALGLVLAVAISGCGDATGGRAGVTGVVTHKGAPLKYGTIEFQSQAPTPECFTGAVVADGKYEVPAESGLLPGKYLVRVSSTGDLPMTTEELPGEAPPPPANIIPPEFSTASKVTFDVAGGDTTFDLEIP